MVVSERYSREFGTNEIRDINMVGIIHEPDMLLMIWYPISAFWRYFNCTAGTTIIIVGARLYAVNNNTLITIGVYKLILFIYMQLHRVNTHCWGNRNNPLFSFENWFENYSGIIQVLLNNKRSWNMALQC